MPIADHERAGGKIAKPLAATVDEERQHANAVEHRQEVDDPDQVADGGLSQGQRLSVIAHHAETDRPFSQRLTVRDCLADQKVTGEQDEGQDDLDQQRQLAGVEDPAQRAGEDGERDQHDRDDQRVDDLRQKPAADAGDLVLERDPLGGGDDQVI